MTRPYQQQSPRYAATRRGVRGFDALKLHELMQGKGQGAIATANALGVSRNAVYKWLRGEGISRQHFKRLTDHLQCADDELLTAAIEKRPRVTLFTGK